jgi:hypothetical protein
MLKITDENNNHQLTAVWRNGGFRASYDRISISDIEFNKFGIRKDNLTFTELVELISRELMRQNLNKCVELAEKYGLSSMTMDEINEEVKAVRNAKNCH